MQAPSEMNCMALNKQTGLKEQFEDSDVLTQVRLNQQRVQGWTLQDAKGNMLSCISCLYQITDLYQISLRSRQLNSEKKIK